MSHFKGKAPLQHVFEARQKGKIASLEIHGAEIPSHLAAASDAAKETAFLIVLFSLFFQASSHLFMLVFFSSFALFKAGRAALLAWARLERLHKLIEEERYEIEHHRNQEREELKELYSAKGFSGKLLDEVIDVLMADDNRLLQVMLEEEFGLNLASYEHPLKQALGAFLGVIAASLLLSFAFLSPLRWPLLLLAALIIILGSILPARFEKRDVLFSTLWNLAVVTLGISAAYFLIKIL